MKILKIKIKLWRCWQGNKRTIPLIINFLLHCFIFFGSKKTINKNNRRCDSGITNHQSFCSYSYDKMWGIILWYWFYALLIYSNFFILTLISKVNVYIIIILLVSVILKTCFLFFTVFFNIIIREFSFYYLRRVYITLLNYLYNMLKKKSTLVLDPNSG